MIFSFLDIVNVCFIGLIGLFVYKKNNGVASSFLTKYANLTIELNREGAKDAKVFFCFVNRNDPFTKEPGPPGRKFYREWGQSLNSE